MGQTFLPFAPFLFVLLWATGFINARLGMPWSEPGTFLAIRFGLACLLLTAFALLARAKWPSVKGALLAVIIGMLLHGIYLGSVFWAIDRGMAAGVAALIVGLQPLMTAFLANLWLGESVSGRHWFGLLIGLAGVFLVLWPDFDVSGAGVNSITVSVCFVGVLSITIGTVLQKRSGGEGDLRSMTALHYLGGFTPVFLLALLMETGEITWNLDMWIAMIWSIFVLSVGAVFLLLWLIREGSISKVSTYLFLVPGVAALMDYLLFGSTLAPIQLLGMAICAFGVAWVNFGSTKQA